MIPANNIECGAKYEPQRPNNESTHIQSQKPSNVIHSFGLIDPMSSDVILMPIHCESRLLQVFPQSDAIVDRHHIVVGRVPEEYGRAVLVAF